MYLFKFCFNNQKHLLLSVTENNLLKAQQTFCTKNKRSVHATLIRNTMDREQINRSAHKLKKHEVVCDKENSNPKTRREIADENTQSGIVVGDKSDTMFNQKDASATQNIVKSGGILKEFNTVLRSSESQVYYEGSKPVNGKPSHLFTRVDSDNVSTAPTVAKKKPGLHIPQYYVDAIKQLNTLQSNLKALKESKARLGNPAETRALEVDQVIMYLARLNVSLEDIKALNVIHVSGTKGKGSTCAYCESILRSNGFSTGFFSSPHLIEVRERIKINGAPIGYDKFTKYFWHVYNTLHAQRSNDGDMPAYFKFLTVMSYYVFVKEKLDVCVMEVGIGGLYDSTNIIPNTAVVGITSLDYDHTGVLGDTMEKITLQKAGIMKPNCIAVTCSNQKDVCKRILAESSRQRNCILVEAPNILRYDWNAKEMDNDWHSTVQSINISLAIQLAYLWMYKMNKSSELKSMIDKFIRDLHTKVMPDNKILTEQSEQNNTSSIPSGPLFKIDDKTYQGIKSCVWPGRVQTIERNNFKYYLDGAHTNDSIRLCSEWFQRKSNAILTRKSRDDVKRILVFNVTGERNPANLLPPLMACNFDYIFITPIVLSSETCPDIQYGGNKPANILPSAGNPNNRVSDTSQRVSHASNGSGTDATVREPPVSISPGGIASIATTGSPGLKNTQDDKVNSIASVARHLSKQEEVVSFANVLDTYNYKYKLDPSKEYHVLVTGSLHLVGAFLNVLSHYE